MMSSPTHRSESNIRRYGKGTRSSKKSVLMYSDYYEEKDDSDVNLGQRSISLTALHPGQVPAVPLEPRMAQLETLEAKMASIEVSLSTTPRRKKNGSIGGGCGGGGGGGVTAVGQPIHRTTASKDIAKELEALRNALRDKENMIQSLKGQLCSTLSISRLSATYLRHSNSGQPLTEKERRAAEERLQRLRQDMDNKRLAIKNLKMALERLDITDNIDVRIQQAELEYQLGREELNLLTLLEESRNLQLCLEDAEQLRAKNDASTIYSCARGADHVTLHAVELNYDPKSPRFGAGPREDLPGLYVEWATEESGMAKGDRLLEVNGKLVLAKTKEDMLRLLAVSPDPAQLVVMRTWPSTSTSLLSTKSTIHQHDHSQELMVLREELGTLKERAEDAERAKDSFRTDNLRLTHRISYLEEQVSELLKRPKEEDTTTHIINTTPLVSSSPATGNLSTMTPTNTPMKPDVQVFQKGPQVTALVANLPGLEVGSSSPAESRHSLPTLRPKLNHHHNTITKNQDVRSTKSLDFGSDCSSSGGMNHHHHHRHEKHSHHRHHHQHLQNARSTNSLDMNKTDGTSSLQLRNKHHSHHRLYETARSAKNIEHPSFDCNSETSYGTDQSKHYHRKHSEPSESHYQPDTTSGTHHIKKHHDVRSVKSLDIDSENSTVTQAYTHLNHSHQNHDAQSTTSLEYGSEPSNHATYRNYKKHHNYHNGHSSCSEGKPQRPTPPKKPLRLSLHRATSLQSVTATPQPIDYSQGSKKPTKRNHKGEAPPAPVVIQMSKDPPQPPPRTPSRAESCQSALRWPSPAAALHQAVTLKTTRNGTRLSSGNSTEKWC
ncbi:uncharacterized protein sprt [Periplaneta americana]|uniref:uncharacterized protein sprt n=1 Tax=Periplaneta americana TaxID=6978 RepID=UPI0037E94CD6